MPITFNQILSSEDIDFDEVTDIYVSSFPENERQPLDKIIYRIDNGLSLLFVIQKEEKIAGMALLWDFKSIPFVLLDYLAIKNEYRGQQLGSSFFQYLLSYCNLRQKQMVIEVEDPSEGDNIIDRIKRVNFYLKNGACILSNVHYILPSLNNTLPTNMKLLLAPISSQMLVDQLTIKKMIERLYIEVYEKSIDDKQMHAVIQLVPEFISLSNIPL